MITLLILVIFLAILDTCFGNRLLPGEVQVIHNEYYYLVRKRTRILFCPIWLYLTHAGDYRKRLINVFGFRDDAYIFRYEEEARDSALLYSKFKHIPPMEKIIWSSKMKKKKQTEEELLIDLGERIHSLPPLEQEELLTRLNKAP